MEILLIVIMLFLLFAGYPLMVPLIVAPLFLLLTTMQNVAPFIVIQQLVAGVSPFVLLAVPMFMLAADIMCTGQTSKRLLDLVQSFVGHLSGGLAITTAATCTLFGAISGSTQATVVAIGRPMHERLSAIDYKDKDSLSLIISSAIIALLIPPSTCMIMYGVVTGTSVGDLFIAGVIPGLIVLLVISIYSYFFAKRAGIQKLAKATKEEKKIAVRRSLAPLGFPIIIFAGIYSGMFSPTEASAISVLYAFILEFFFFKSIKLKDMKGIFLSTAIVTSAVFILLGAGQIFSWVMSYAKIPELLTATLLGGTPSTLKVLVVITAFFFVGCMFVDSLVVIIVLTPIFFPLAMQVGIDPVHLGIIVTLQAAIGSITPPFGCNIFTACVVFGKSFMEVVSGLKPYILLLVLCAILITAFPNISLILLDFIK